MGIGPETRGRRKRLRPYLAVVGAVALAAGAAAAASAASASTANPNSFAGYKTTERVSTTLWNHNKTATPIKHLVVIFDENETFDHYFGTYPYAANTDGTSFYAKPGTKTVNGLYTTITKSGPTGPLLTNNPNGLNPQRLTHSEALTPSNNHSYTPEQKAEDNGKMDAFITNTQTSAVNSAGCGPEYCPPGIVLDYYDGNTVTALWNYAQYYSMSDNNWDPSFGPSSPGAVEVTSGLTSGAEAFNPPWDTVGTPNAPATSGSIVDVNSSTSLGTLNGDIDPYYDGCSDGSHSTNSALGVLTGENIGNLLDNSHVTWGWFQGGFAPTSTTDGLPVCGSTHDLTLGNTATTTDNVTDYVAHHEPFQYYASTSNPDHLAPSQLSLIGYQDQANHQYDISDFTDALDGTGGAKLPSVSYLKPPAYENGHPGNSDPLDEQNFVVNTVNSIEKSKYWPSTAIVITYDDSDGWYDHQAPTIITGSDDPAIDTAECTSVAVTVGSVNGRCGYSQRLPLIVISPYTRENYVSSNLTDTSSVVKFIEDNWLHGESIPGSFDSSSGSLYARGGVLDFNTLPHFRPVILDPTTGAVVSGGDFWGNYGEKKK